MENRKTITESEKGESERTSTSRTCAGSTSNSIAKSTVRDQFTPKYGKKSHGSKQIGGFNAEPMTSLARAQHHRHLLFR